MPSAGTPVLNIVDISQYNDNQAITSDNINFARLATEVDGVYIRAFGCDKTTGVPYIDKQAVHYANSAQKNNLDYGFYYYFIPSADLNDAVAQARNFYEFVNDYPYRLRPVIDVENNLHNLSRDQMAAAVKTFANTFKALSGFDLMAYTYPYFIKDQLNSSYAVYHLWIAHYNVPAPMTGLDYPGKVPKSTWVWERWDMWQYTSKGTLSSIPSSASGFLDMSYATDNILLETPQAVVHYDSPNTGMNGGDIAIQGWALSHSGNARIDIYLDGDTLLCSLDEFSERPDVQKIVNANGRYYDGIHSGFSFLIDASRFSPGNHKLEAVLVSRNGVENRFSYSFVVGPESLICLDQPASDVITGDITVSGWALSHAGISRIDLYVDDYSWIGSTSAISERSDVNTIVNSHGMYKDALHSGFSYNIDASRLSAGEHVLRIAAISKDGTACWTNKTVTVGPAPIMCLDSPSQSGIYGKITVAGWALNHAGIAKIELYADNNLLCVTNELSKRSDVNQIMSANNQYRDALHSGFYFDLPAGTLSAGKHTLKIGAVGKDGTTQWITKTIDVKTGSVTCLDNPVTGNISGDILVSGWSISYAGLSRVDIYVDDFQWVGSTDYIFERSDVNSIMNADGRYPDALHSGFGYVINAGRLSPGKHTLYIAAISKDNTVQWITREINVA